MLEYNINIIQVIKSRIFNFGGDVVILSKNKLNLNLVKTETFASFENATYSISTNLGRLNITIPVTITNTNILNLNSCLIWTFSYFLC